jgi:hypothetical protein
MLPLMSNLNAEQQGQVRPVAQSLKAWDAALADMRAAE